MGPCCCLGVALCLPAAAEVGSRVSLSPVGAAPPAGSHGPLCHCSHSSLPPTRPPDRGGQRGVGAAPGQGLAVPAPPAGGQRPHPGPWARPRLHAGEAAPAALVPPAACARRRRPLLLLACSSCAPLPCPLLFGGGCTARLWAPPSSPVPTPRCCLLLAAPQVVYCASVGSYFKGGQLTPIDLIVETHFHRCGPGARSLLLLG